MSTQNGPDFVIHRNDGTSFEVDISNAHTVQDVLNIINQHPDNQDPNTLVQATLSQYSNAITILDDDPILGNTLSVEVVAGSSAAVDLGLVPVGSME